MTQYKNALIKADVVQGHLSMTLFRMDAERKNDTDICHLILDAKSVASDEKRCRNDRSMEE
jgi:hypothetical protein